ncbi:MAG TPA: ComF family protein [bacterium]|nr:ComF family protein [bacterium]
MSPSRFLPSVLNLLFPRICINCQKEGNYLCPDCFSLLEISESHQKCPGKNLDDVYFALPYKGALIKKLVRAFKYPPFIKELGQTMSGIIIAHFQMSSNVENFKKYIVVPVPLEKKRMKWRGFNQAEEIARHLANYFKLPLVLNALIKTNPTTPQVNLSSKKREENLKGVFSIRNAKSIYGKNILLVDDVYTTGSTMEECSGVLRQAGAKKIVGIAIARAAPGED